MSKKRIQWKRKQKFQRFLMRVLNERSQALNRAYYENKLKALDDLRNGLFDL